MFTINCCASWSTVCRVTCVYVLRHKSIVFIAELFPLLKKVVVYLKPAFSFGLYSVGIQFIIYSQSCSSHLLQKSVKQQEESLRLVNVHLHTAASYRDQCKEAEEGRDSVTGQLKDAKGRTVELTEELEKLKEQFGQETNTWKQKVQTSLSIDIQSNLT